MRLVFLCIWLLVPAAWANENPVQIPIQVVSSGAGFSYTCNEIEPVEFTTMTTIHALAGTKCTVSFGLLNTVIDVAPKATYFCGATNGALNCDRTDAPDVLAPPPIMATQERPLQPGFTTYTLSTTPLQRSPNPTTAVALSALAGFGAGHYYAGNKSKGVAHSVIQGGSILGSVALTYANIQTVANQSDGADVNGVRTRANVAIGLAGVALVARIVDIATAADSAHAHQNSQMSRRTVTVKDVWWPTAESIYTTLGLQLDKTSSDWRDLVLLVRQEGKQGATPSALVAAVKVGQQRDNECKPAACLSLGLQQTE